MSELDELAMRLGIHDEQAKMELLAVLVSHVDKQGKELCDHRRWFATLDILYGTCQLFHLNDYEGYISTHP